MKSATNLILVRYPQAENPAAQTTHLFFCHPSIPTLTKIKELFFTNGQKNFES